MFTPEEEDEPLEQIAVPISVPCSPKVLVQSRFIPSLITEEEDDSVVVLDDEEPAPEVEREEEDDAGGVFTVSVPLPKALRRKAPAQSGKAWRFSVEQPKSPFVPQVA